FRYLNYLIASVFCYKAMSEVYDKHRYFNLFYAETLVCILTTVFAQAWFSIFFFIYLNIDTGLATYLLSQVPRDVVIPKFSLGMLILAEGIGVSSIIALSLPQLFDWLKRVPGEA